ncbi:MAG: hypothetical protein ACJ75B_18800 [Flavisolibacter sp.]
MDKQNKSEKNEQTPRHENPLPREISTQEKQQAASAHDEAEHDMENDAEFSAHSPNDDLDEGESARLGEDLSSII